MATTLHKIEFPNLVENNFGSNLVKAFENIDSNFQKLASLGLTTGESGMPAIWVPYNLNSVFCYVSGDDFVSNHLSAELVEEISQSYRKYNEITGFSKIRYIAECALLYDELIFVLTDPTEELIEVHSGDESSQKVWRHNWEKKIILKDIFPDTASNESEQMIYDAVRTCTNLRWEASESEDSTVATYLEQYIDFIPGDILVAGNYDAESNTFTKLGSTAHIYIDPRFRNPLTIAGRANAMELSQATDQSCVLYGTPYHEGKEFTFELVHAFPRVHCDEDGQFFLSVNGIDTNIPLTGAAGKAGKDSQFVTVQIQDNDSYYQTIDDIVYGHDGENFPNSFFVVGKKIGIDGDISESVDLAGCPAIIFPPAGYTANAYLTLYWVGYLQEKDGKLQAYCGRENLVTVDLYEHSFSGMMMGLDMYEQSIARPAGNAPWTKPRGLMLPIGERYIGTENHEYWDPTAGYNDGQMGSADVNHFGAHLIYSKKSGGDLKKELHIGSIDDYRRIGKPNDVASDIDYTPDVASHKVSGTQLFIDEPVTITDYGSTEPTEDILFTNIGSSEIKGNSHIVGNSHIEGDEVIDKNETIGGNLVVGTDGNNGVITANRFERRNAQSGQLLLADGKSTLNKPIKIMNSAANADPASAVPFEIINNVDGQLYFLGDISTLVPQQRPMGIKYELMSAGSFSYVDRQVNGGSGRWVLGLTNMSGNWHGVGTDQNWKDTRFNKAIPSEVSSRVPSTNRGLCGVYFSYQSGYTVITKVLIAANGNTVEASDCYTYGLPIGSTDEGNDNHDVERFKDIKIETLDAKVRPTSRVTQYCGAQYSFAAPGDDHDREVPMSGVTCSIDTDGSILLSGAATNYLFSLTDFDSRKKDEYLEFTFVYQVDNSNEDDSGGSVAQVTQYYWTKDSITFSNNTATLSLNMSDASTIQPTANSGYIISGKYRGSSTPTGTVSITVTRTGTSPNYEYTCSTNATDWYGFYLTSAYVQTYSHYWKLTTKPTSSTQLSASGTNYHAEEIPSDWDGDDSWYLVTLISTKQSLPNSSTINYGSTGSGDWGTNWSSTQSNVWNYQYKPPTVISYKWNYGTSDTVTDNVKVKEYLEDTQLLRVSESDSTSLTGNLMSEISAQKKSYSRYDGPFGTVHLYVNGATSGTIGNLTLDAWVWDNDNSKFAGTIHKSYQIEKLSSGGPITVDGSTMTIKVKY